MNRQSAAVAVFVKTPRLSPIKTRLAVDIGLERSAEFYHLSVTCIAATVAAVAKSTGATPYWAVAEEAGLDDPLWQQFPCVSQGEGDLGDRLHTVFDELILQHTAVVLIGADSPQLTPTILKHAIQFLIDPHDHFNYVLGRTHDGGFYLFGSNAQIQQEAWSTIPYSTVNTAESLAANLLPSGNIRELARLTDVDVVEDLAILRNELLTVSAPIPDQICLLKWLEQTIGDLQGNSDVQ